jgi:His-Xaa-Ser system protein HxsD
VIPKSATPSIWDIGGHVCLLVDVSIYPIEVALAAGYKFTDRAFVWLESSPESPSRYYIFLRPRIGSDDLRALSGAFTNELLDQALRQRLEQQFRGLRTLMAAQAFSEGNLLTEDDEPSGNALHSEADTNDQQ